MLENGMIVDGKYKILNKIGRGGMSTVYLAMNERANRQWAIKEIQKKGNRYYRTMREELLAETDILKRLDHPNLPKIADVLEYKDIFLIVMDYIEGRPLSLTLQEQGAQSQEVVVAWAKQLCDVLEYLHSRKPPIIYRDMKPANIMLRPDGRVMLIDFGTARESKEEHVEDTICLGTVGYAAPEQFGGNGQTDARTDIFCLGRTLYHLLTGHNPCMPPYEIYPIRHWNPQLSSGLEEIIWKCVQNDPQERYQSCAELLYALEHYREFDVECKRQQQKKWRIFVCSAVCTLAFAAGAVGFRCAEEKTVRNSYERVMKEASSSVTREKQIANYRKAIALNPRKADAYELLLEKVFLTDDNFSQEEAAMMLEILQQRGMNKKDYLSVLESEQNAYGKVAFRIGIAYFYYYEGEGNKQLSGRWFVDAAKSETLEEHQRVRAKMLGKIAGYYAQLNRNDRAGDSKVTYREYWEDLTELIKGNIVAIDNEKTALVMYQELVYQIGQNADKFYAEGIKREEMSKQLEKVKERLRTDLTIQNRGVQKEIEKKKEELVKNISWAEEEVKTICTIRNR